MVASVAICAFKESKLGIARALDDSFSISQTKNVSNTPTNSLNDYVPLRILPTVFGKGASIYDVRTQVFLHVIVKIPAEMVTFIAAAFINLTRTMEQD